MEDAAKVQAKLDELNRQAVGLPLPLLPLASRPWTVFQGFMAVTSVSVSPGGMTFNPASGVPVKAFRNNQTGEIRLFDYRMFLV